MLPLGRVVGHRGLGGELTVRVHKGNAGRWTELSRIWIGESDGSGGSFYEIENIRAYRDRLVLKLKGLDDATSAAFLRGKSAKVLDADAPELPAGVYYAARLLGMAVLDEKGDRIGVVRDVVPTGGTDVLVVERDGEDPGEVLIPFADEIVMEVDEGRNRVRVRMPDGLLDLNR
jgi:16S rRNA processing protein RimM